MRTLIVLAALALAVGACDRAGNNITSPSDLERNLNSAPPGAFEIGNAEIVVRFWWDITPPPGSVVGAGDTTSATFQCRANSGEDYGVSVVKATYIAPDGSEARVPGLNLQGGLFTRDCAPGTTLGNINFLGPATKFVGLREVQLQAKLERRGGGSLTVANFVQPIGWIAR